MYGAASYKSVQNETAGKERQLVLLFEAALRFIQGGAQAIEKGTMSQANQQLGKAKDIVAELHRCLDHARAPKLCETLASVYEYVAVELSQATITRDVVHCRNAERALAPIVDAFRQAVAQVLAQPTRAA